MARPLRFAAVSLCLCLSTALAAPVQASPHARATPAAAASPGSMKTPSSSSHTKRETAPVGTPGIPFAPVGPRWLQPRVMVHYGASTDPAVPTTPYFVVRSASGGPPIVIAVTPPGEPMPPPPSRRRLPSSTAFAVGLLTFGAGYVATALHGKHMSNDCEGEAACQRHASTLMIPLAGPIMVANHTRDARHVALATVQGAGLLLTVIGAIVMLSERHSQRALDESGIRLSKNTRLRPDGGPAGGQLTIHGRF
jgi:hypothetical protein